MDNPIQTKAPQRLDQVLGPGQLKLIADLRELLEEAEAGEFDDFSNVKYAAPKMALGSKLYEMRERVIRGIYD